MLSEGRKVTAGTLSPHRPTGRTITASEVHQWIAEEKWRRSANNAPALHVRAAHRDLQSETDRIQNTQNGLEVWILSTACKSSINAPSFNSRFCLRCLPYFADDGCHQC